MSRDRTPSAWKRAIRFLRDVRELAKVIWPTRKERVTYTIGVVLTVVLVSAFEYGLDVGFSEISSRLFVKTS